MNLLVNVTNGIAEEHGSIGKGKTPALLFQEVTRMEGSLERIILISNPKENYNYNVTVPEDREDNFIKLMQSNGFRYDRKGGFKQTCLTVDLTVMSRNEK